MFCKYLVVAFWLIFKCVITWNKEPLSLCQIFDTELFAFEDHVTFKRSNWYCAKNANRSSLLHSARI